MIRFNVVDDRISMVVRESNRVRMSVEQAVVVRPESEVYAGPYDVTPKVTQQVLPTKEKFLSDDVRIKEIPTYNVSNTAGGSTFYIATMNEDPQGGIAILGKAKLGSMIL